MTDWKTLIPFVLATGQHPPLKMARVIGGLTQDTVLRSALAQLGIITNV